MNRRGFLTLGLTGTALAGCGFQPVYMPTASGKPGVAERELASIDVAIIPDRPGQLLRQALQDHFASDGGGSHRYRLITSFYIAGENVNILTNNSASRVRLIGTANWQLLARDPAAAKLTSGTSRAIDGYNVFSAQYAAAIMDNEAVQKRIAESVADQMTLQLATWFRARGSAATG
jgi:LPS-assembly lipoprotein